MHREIPLRYSDISQKSRELFWEKVDKNGPIHFEFGPCWLWTGQIDRFNGYGLVRINGTRERTHRIAYILEYDKIPKDLFVLHRCDIRACVNYEHLFLGTHQDNILDMNEKGRQAGAMGEKNSHAILTEDQVCDIRRLYLTGGWTHKDLGEIYGVSPDTIARVTRGESWTHV